MSSLSTPAAIVAGFGMLSVATGLGLYFGLRGHASPAVESPPSVATLTGATPRTTGGAVVETVHKPGVSTAVTADSARGAIAAQHAQLVTKCWDPSFARNPVPAQVSLTLVMTFGEDGRVTSHSLKPDMLVARPDVTSCVYDLLVLPVVSPPERRMQLSVPITLP